MKRKKKKRLVQLDICQGILICGTVNLNWESHLTMFYLKKSNQKSDLIILTMRLLFFLVFSNLING
jgi:hypothetical protein